MSKKPQIVMSIGDKGGTGKTTTARIFCDYVARRRAVFKIYDGEFSGDLVRFFPQAEVIDLSVVRDQRKVFDDMAGLTLIDLRAGQATPTIQNLNKVGLLDDVRADTVGLALLHVIGPSDRSIREIAETAAMIGPSVKHYIIRNHFSADGGFSEWETDPRFAAALSAMEGATATIPHLCSDATDAVQKLGGSFTSFATDGNQSRILRGYVREWQNTVFREFDRLGLGDLIAAAIG